jgi:hypothetical protein
MNIIQLVYAWPSEARYSCDPENYDGWAIEDHGLEMGSSHIQIGDQRTWEKHRWIVATVQPYTSQNGDSIFEIAILTLDGNPPQSTDPAEGETMYICIAPSGFTFGWPEHPEALPEPGSPAPDLEGWAVSSLQSFIPQSQQGIYREVILCWCAAVLQPTEIVAMR